MTLEERVKRSIQIINGEYEIGHLTRYDFEEIAVLLAALPQFAEERNEAVKKLRELGSDL